MAVRVWLATAVLAGMVLAARRLPGANCRIGGRTLAGGGLTYLAVGCPICNKIVVALLGVSGALNYFAPVQPVLAVVSLVILFVTLQRILQMRTPGTARMVPDKSAKLPNTPDPMNARV